MITKDPIKLAHLYPKEMNLYGDTGNRIVLEKRMAWRGIPYKTILVNVGDELPIDADIVIGGGGQDASQGSIEQDFISKKQELISLVETNCVMLMICGMYQLLGRQFITQDGTRIGGLGILPLETRAESGRIIGNVVVNVEGIGDVVGYENHSGRTYLDKGVSALGRVIKGKGNNDHDHLEGCRYGNIFGTYMHGPVLSKNPEFADLLISLALLKKGASGELVALDDSLEQTARKIATSRPR